MNVKRLPWIGIGLSIATSVSLFAQSTRPEAPDEVEIGRETLASDPGRGKLMLETAAARLEAEFARQPANAHLIHRAGMAYFYLGDGARAVAALARATEVEPGNAGYRYMAGRAFAVRKEWEPARAQLERAVEIDPKMDIAWMQLGRVHIELNRIDDACKAFAQAAMLAPDDARAHARLGEALIAAGRPLESVPTLRRALQLDPADAVSWYNLGQVLQNQSDPAESLKAFTEAARLRPDDWRAKAKIVQCHAALGDVKAREEAILEVRRLKDEGKVSAESFCREQFDHAGARVMVYDQFKPTGDRPVRYTFRVMASAGKPAYYLSLGSYDATTSLARQSGEIGPDERIWHLDGYFPDELRTYKILKVQPPYDEVKAMVLAVLDGTLKPATTIKRPADGPADAPREPDPQPH